MDINYFFGSDFTAFAAEPLRFSVSLQWALDLMCEKLMGVSNFPFFVVVSLKDPPFQDPRSLTTYFFVFCHLRWCILPSHPLFEWMRNSVTDWLSFYGITRASDKTTREEENTARACLLRREQARMVGILPRND